MPLTGYNTAANVRSIGDRVGRALLRRLGAATTNRSVIVMAVKVAISGFGRIGRNVLRALAESKRTDVQVVAINDLSTTKENAHLFKYDSVHGRFHGEVNVSADTFDIGSGPIKVLAEK